MPRGDGACDIFEGPQPESDVRLRARVFPAMAAFEARAKTVARAGGLAEVAIPATRAATITTLRADGRGCRAGGGESDGDAGCGGDAGGDKQAVLAAAWAAIAPRPER